MTNRLLLLTTLLCGACGSDPFIGTYNVTVTGTETETAPRNAMRTINGLGTVSVSQNKDRNGYIIVLGEPSYLCRLTATRGSSGGGLELDLPGGQTCNVQGYSGTAADAKLTIDPQTLSSVTLTVPYAFTYTATFENHAGTGTRTYTGPRL